MNKTLLKTAMFATITSFAVTGQTWAHHPSEDVNPNYDFVDEQISDMHNEVIDEMLEDDDMMNSLRSAAGGTSQSRETSGSSTSAGPARGRR